MTQKKIIRRENKNNQALADLHPLLQRIYSSRSITTPQELDRSLQGLLPFDALLGLPQAVTLLAKALKHEERILIVGDFDADGATSTTLAMRALTSFGAKYLRYLVPNRFAFGYGLTPELVQAAEDFAPQLIVTVDNGIANHAGVETAKAKGIKVIITDHHLPAATLPNADAIVNPNQPNDPFPSKNLAGVGVIFYVMLGLRRHLVNIKWFEQQGINAPNMANLLDLVALGTVADLVQLDQNNRALVHQGLRRIRAGYSVPGMPALLELAGRDFQSCLASDLGFAVGSRLNAAGRLDDMSLGIECLLCDDPVKARHLARQLDQLNRERRLIEREMQQQALKVLDQLTVNQQNQFPWGVCLFDPAWHQGVIGILAARIKDRFHRPTIVFALGPNGELKGSARSISGLHIRDLLALIDANHPTLIHKFGGHAMAAGLTIHRDQFDFFSQLFNDMLSQQLTDADLQHNVISDGELADEHFNVDMVTLLQEGGPWGQAFPEPLFDDQFDVVEQRIVGDKHLKLKLSKNKKMMDAICFFVDLEKWPNHRCQSVRAAYRLDINEFKGQRNLQLIVEYLEPMI